MPSFAGGPTRVERRENGGVDPHGLIDDLRAIAGDEHVLVDRDQRRTYESDGLLQYAVLPGVVVLPGTYHALQVERPDLLSDAIVKWQKGL